MRNLLLAIFGGILLGMLWVTTVACMDRSVLAAGSELMVDPWFHATLADAYFGFLTFYVWVAYKEKTWVSRVLWFVGIMLLGNIAMSIYMLIRLARLSPEGGWRELLLREDDVALDASKS